MIYCKRCLYPANHPLGLDFDADGVCMGCRVHEEKDRLDWAAREQRLLTILDDYRDRGDYDCILPVSGGRDSFFIADRVIRVYGMNPLLVSFNRHYNTAAGVFNLEQLRSQLGADMVVQTLDPRLYRRLIRLSLDRLGSVHWPYLAGSTVFPVQMAVRRRIPLIIWGAHQGLEQVGMFSHTDEVEMTRRYRREHDLMGLEPEDAADPDSGVPEADLAPLFYPEDRQLNAVGVRGIYLGNYLRWDVKAQHEAMLDRHDYCVAPQPRTFDSYSDVDCAVHADLHDEIKTLKWGYGKATDHACREIRFGRLTRDQGAALVRRHDAARATGFDAFAGRIGIDAAEIRAQAISRRDPRLPPLGAPGCSPTGAVFPPAAEPAAPVAADGVFRVNLPARMARPPFDPALLLRGDAILPGETRRTGFRP
jgi:N-acetyl sugar amidotransferase